MGALILRWLGAPLLVGLFGGCAMMSLPPSYVANGQTLPLSPIIVYQGGTGPLSYHSPAVHDAHQGPQGAAKAAADANAPPAPAPAVQVVVGEACESGFELPWAYSRNMMGALSAGWGEGGYVEALTRAQAKAPAHSLLYDVRVDMRHTSVLSLWRQLCLMVTASVAPAPTAPTTPFDPNEAMQSHGQNTL